MLRPSNTFPIPPRERPRYVFGVLQVHITTQAPGTCIWHEAALVWKGSDFWLSVLGLCICPGPQEAKEPQKGEKKKNPTKTLKQFTDVFILEAWTSCTSPKWPVVKTWESTAGLSFLPGPASEVPQGCLLEMCFFFLLTSSSGQCSNVILPVWCRICELDHVRIDLG